jgi:lysine 2,3-aminomutase
MGNNSTPEAVTEVEEQPPPKCQAGFAPTAIRPDPLTAEATREARETDWRWQMRNRIRTVAQLLRRFPALRAEASLPQVAQKYPLSITPYYASLIRAADISDPIFQLAVPQMDELFDPPFLEPDPLGEEQHMPVPGLIHRYPDRALVMATTTCAMYCRHCTRKRVAGTVESALAPRDLGPIGAYLRAHPEIRDVIVSGGDPLTLATSALERILAAIRAVPSVDIIRIGTRAPVVMPMRVTAELTAMLRRYHPLWINTHFNHPQEITPAAIAACAQLADAGIPLGNQTVLLHGVNDQPQIIEDLCRCLVRMRVRPYYLFQCDLVRGIEHFRTPIAKGLEIMEHLRGRVSGLAIPTFVVDSPHGGGKIPLLPNYLVRSTPSHTELRTCDGRLVAYPEPGAQLDEPPNAQFGILDSTPAPSPAR